MLREFINREDRLDHVFWRSEDSILQMQSGSLVAWMTEPGGRIRKKLVLAGKERLQSGKETTQPPS